MGVDFPKVVEYDYHKTPVNKIPALNGVKNHKQIGAVVEITPSGTVEYWISFFNGPYKVPLVYCPTAVMAAEAYPFIDSGQISGMLNGVVGAAQYETLIGFGCTATDASAAAWALSSAHIFIILLIILGNVSFILMRKSEKTINRRENVNV